jgi:5-methylcytosine-specific restriction endonuclease McrA
MLALAQRQGGRTIGGSPSYDWSWEKLRLQHLAKEPLCRFCVEAGRVTAASHVDHIRPFNGLADLLRLDPNNLRSLCQPHHMSRTGRQAPIEELAE